VNKMKKVLSGCTRKSNQKYNDCDMTNPILAEEEFKFEASEPAGYRQITTDQSLFPIYNDYDTLDRPCLAKHNNALKDTTNMKKSKGIKRCFLRTSSTSKILDDNNNNGIMANENFRYSGLYDSKTWDIKKVKNDYEDEALYCEIGDEENGLVPECQPLIDLNQLQIKTEEQSEKKMNLFAKFTNENQNTDIDKDIKSLTDLRSPESFSSPEEGFHWYLNLINNKILNCIQTDTTLNDENRTKRLNIAKAHFLYSRNFYEMRISGSVQLKAKLAKIHPCLIVLAVLLDSEAVRIEESHVCVCDSYIYLFSTRLKYCAWKSKLFILLKKPKRSSFDRLNLIEDLTSCHKLIQEKST